MDRSEQVGGDQDAEPATTPGESSPARRDQAEGQQPAFVSIRGTQP